MYRWVSLPSPFLKVMWDEKGMRCIRKSTDVVQGFRKPEVLEWLKSKGF